MRLTHLAGIDLNLLPLLEALLAERHVTRAAGRVGLSQPAASRGLARLRTLLDDPLLVRSGPRLRLTPRGEALLPLVQRALGLVEEAVAPPVAFDPARARRTVRMLSDDYNALVVLTPLLARLTHGAPGIDVRVLPVAGSGMDRLAAGDVDFYFAPAGEKTAPGVHTEALATDRFVCMVARTHPFARRRPGLDRFLEARHALIAPLGGRGGAVDDALAALGKQRRVALMLPHFLAMPFCVAASDLVLTLAERVARTYRGLLPVTLFRPPLPLPGFTLGCYWHDRDLTDPALAWLRRQISATGAALSGPSARRRQVQL